MRQKKSEIFYTTKLAAPTRRKHQSFVGDKRGFLLAEETLKIVIAVISISFLIYFLFSLYMSNQTNKDLQQAEATLEHLVSEINSGRTEIEIYNPSPIFEKGIKIGVWELMSWPQEGKTPNSCSSLGWETCFCICQENNLKSCDKKGSCIEDKDGFVIEGKSIKLENLPITLNIDKEAKIIR